MRAQVRNHDDEPTPILRPTRMFSEITELRRRVARVELTVSIALAMSTGLFVGLLAYVARTLAG